MGPPPRAGGSRLAAAWSQAARPPSPPGPWLGRWSGLSGAVPVVVVVGGVAGDQDPGEGPVTGQPPTRLRGQRPHPTRITPQARVDGRGGCPGPRSPAAGAGPHPIWGSRPRFQVAAGQLGRGHQRGVGSQSGCRWRRPGGPAVPGQPAAIWPASASSSPSTATMPSQVGASHRPRRSWLAFGLGLGALGVGGQPGDGPRPAAAAAGPAAAPPPPAPVQPRRPGGRASSWVPWASTWAWATEMLAINQGLGGARSGGHRTGPGRSAPPWRPPPPPSAAGPAASRRSSRPAAPSSAPAAPRASTRGQLAQPQAFLAVQQPPPDPHPLGPGGVGEPVRVLGGQLLELGHHRRQPRRLAGRMCVRVHDGNLSSPHPNTSTQPTFVDNRSAGRPRRRERPHDTRPWSQRRTRWCSARACAPRRACAPPPADTGPADPELGRCVSG